MSEVVRRHRAEARVTPRFALITVSTSRANALREGRSVHDESGDLAEALIRRAGFEVVSRAIVPDNIHEIRDAVSRAVRSGANVVVLIGGTGVSPSDVTPEAVRPMLDKELPGFGELFRYLSYRRVGSAAMMSRALAGVMGQVAVFCLPGSPDAVELALRELILPEITHLLSILRG